MLTWGRKSIFNAAGLFKRQPLFRILYQYFVHLVLSDTSRQHFGNNILQDVGEAMTAVLGQSVLGVNIMGNEESVFITFFDQESQASATRQNYSQWSVDDFI